MERIFSKNLRSFRSSVTAADKLQPLFENAAELVIKLIDHLRLTCPAMVDEPLIFTGRSPSTMLFRYDP